MADLKAQDQLTRRLSLYMIPSSWSMVKAAVTALFNCCQTENKNMSTHPPLCVETKWGSMQNEAVGK